jgi:hypothetical protein
MDILRRVQTGEDTLHAKRVGKYLHSDTAETLISEYTMVNDPSCAMCVRKGSPNAKA